MNASQNCDCSNVIKSLRRRLRGVRSTEPVVCNFSRNWSSLLRISLRNGLISILAKIFYIPTCFWSNAERSVCNSNKTWNFATCDMKHLWHPQAVKGVHCRVFIHVFTYRFITAENKSGTFLWLTVYVRPLTKPLIDISWSRSLAALIGPGNYQPNGSFVTLSTDNRPSNVYKFAYKYIGLSFAFSTVSYWVCFAMILRLDAGHLPAKFWLINWMFDWFVVFYRSLILTAWRRWFYSCLCKSVDYLYWSCAMYAMHLEFTCTGCGSG